LDVIDAEVEILEREGRPLNQALTLTPREDRTTSWREDKRWDEVMNIIKVLASRKGS
jgi:hypothetical protein